MTELADKLGATHVRTYPDTRSAVAAQMQRLNARCARCGCSFTTDDWDDRHTPGTRVLHADCCDECEDS